MSFSLSLSLSLCKLAFWALTASSRASPTLLPDLRNVPIVRSSHSAAAAIVANYLNLTDGARSAVAIQGDIEGAIYSCMCKKNLHYWHIAPGLKTWAGAYFKLIDTSEKCLRSNDPKEQITFAQVCKEIEAKRPFVITLSFDSSSMEGLHACLDAQQRISVVGVGYDKDSQSILVLLPKDIEKDANASALPTALSSLPDSFPDSPIKSDLRLLHWDSAVANVVFTMVRP